MRNSVPLPKHDSSAFADLDISPIHLYIGKKSGFHLLDDVILFVNPNRSRKRLH
jgi:hypothetical protein